MSSSSSALFSGTSRYSSDFSAVIERAVAIASLPLTQLQQSQQAVQDESAALTSLNSRITAVATAVSNLATAAAQKSYSTTISSATVLSASAGTGALEGSYTIEVTDLGAYSTAMSVDGLHQVADPDTETISPRLNPTYTLNGVTITPASNTLNSLAAAINATDDLEIQATVVNIGSTASPDYRLALQSKKLDAVAMQLNDGGQDLFSSDPPNGSKATYKINGVNALPTDSRTITPAPGVTVNLISEGTATVTIAQSTNSISNALSAFANAYNAAADELDKHRGANAGALAGQALVTTVWDTLRSAGQYNAGSGDLTSLSDLGLTFDDKGHMSFDTATFADATRDNHTALTTFLGDAADSGFLKFATDVMTGLQGDTDGILTTATSAVSAEVTRMGNKITDEQTRIDTLRENLTTQMAAADALIASLEQQANYINNMFEAMRIAQQAFN